MSRDSTTRVLGVAFVLCLVCSVLVSVAAVALSDRQERNKIEEKHRNILQAAGLYRADVPIDEQYARIEPRIVDLHNAWFSEDVDPASFNSRSAASDPQLSDQIAGDRDVAGIRTRSRYQDVYLVRDGDKLLQVILPVYGKGLWSTMYGFISLADDLSTVNGFAFYEHGETPGLGGEIDNPNWKKQWRGKRIFDDSGSVRIQVLKGVVDKSSPDAVYQADGLAGATLTARGVGNLLQYWMGEDGYKPFLEKLKQQGI